MDMMTEQGDFWYCDSCWEKITTGAGEVVWMQSDPNIAGGCKGLTIIHKNKKCRYSNEDCEKNHAIEANVSLETMLGPDGLMHLLRFLSDDNFEDKENVLEIIKRLQIPGYEQARFFINASKVTGVFGGDPKPQYCLLQEDIAIILKHKGLLSGI